MRGNPPGIPAGLLMAGILQGCSISPAQVDAIRRAWEERDAMILDECRKARDLLLRLGAGVRVRVGGAVCEQAASEAWGG